jgi:hypothetical protein
MMRGLYYNNQPYRYIGGQQPLTPRKIAHIPAVVQRPPPPRKFLMEIYSFENEVVTVIEIPTIIIVPIFPHVVGGSIVPESVLIAWANYQSSFPAQQPIQHPPPSQPSSFAPVGSFVPQAILDSWYVQPPLLQQEIFPPTLQLPIATGTFQEVLNSWYNQPDLSLISAQPVSVSAPQPAPTDASALQEVLNSWYNQPPLFISLAQPSISVSQPPPTDVAALQEVLNSWYNQPEVSSTPAQSVPISIANPPPIITDPAAFQEVLNSWYSQPLPLFLPIQPTSISVSQPPPTDVAALQEVLNSWYNQPVSLPQFSAQLFISGMSKYEFIFPAQTVSTDTATVLVNGTGATITFS